MATSPMRASHSYQPLPLSALRRISWAGFEDVTLSEWLLMPLSCPESRLLKQTGETLWPKGGGVRRLRVAERSTFGLEPLLVLCRNRSVKSAWDVPPERAAESRPLADALGRATAPEPPRVLDPLDDAQAF